MSRTLILYATTHGQTRKVATALGEELSALGVTADVVRVDDHPAVRPEPYDAVIVAASVHVGGYQRPIRRWTHLHSAALSRMPSAFVTVCLAVLETRPETRRELAAIRDRFLRRSGWQPTTTKYVAGAVRYTRYHPLVRWVMRRIVAKAGGGTDTTRDYEYTDWEDLRRWAGDFARAHGLAMRAGSAPLAV
jgi:menaquinone-dependent protoporphyrinogen oxidase